MNNQELKRAISEDVNTIKGLDPDIIPAKTYYSGLLKLFASGFWKIWLIVSMTIAYSGIHNPSNDGLAREAASQVIREATLMAFFMSIVIMLLLTPSINFFIQFRFHLKDKLKTGDLVAKKLKLVAYVYFGCFLLLSAFFGSMAESAAIFLMVVFAFFGSLAATFFIVKMELNRVGLSTIFTVINEFFNKGKPIEQFQK